MLRMLLQVMLLLLVLILLISQCLAHTRPEQLQAILALRDSQLNKSSNWRKALDSWVCPTDPSDSTEECDPCSKDWSGNWEHIHCRGTAAEYGEGSKGLYDGYITNIHITDQHLAGPMPREFCGLDHIRELDLDGGDLSGPFPEWVMSCLPLLQELDFSYNRLTGTLPAGLSTKPFLQEIKIEFNEMVGTIPATLAAMPHLRVLRIEYNHFIGRIPQAFRNLSKTLTQFDFAHNDLEGDLSALAHHRLLLVTVHDNPRLCGMIPATVRYAKNFNPANTRLGKPCDD